VATYTIGKFAKRFGLSRSTLLYYDAQGLLTPSERGANGYRLYTDADAQRMEAIQRYRSAGIPLKEIDVLLDEEQGKLAARLEQRLADINDEISRLRYQQQVIVVLLQSKTIQRRTRVLNKKKWVALLEASGLDESGMRRWHHEFEAMSPEAHQDFLESLGIPAKEIRAIRRWSRTEAE